MKKLFIAGIIMLLVLPGAFAQLRLDLGIDVPFIVGVSVDDLDGSGSSGSESFDVLSIGTFPFPEAMFAYQADLGPVRIGAGLRGYSFIIETIAWPHIYAETELSKFVFSGGIGGGAFLMFGLYNDMATGSVFIPEATVTYKLGKSFRLGVGAMGFTSSDADAFPYVLFFTGRFSMLFDE